MRAPSRPLRPWPTGLASAPHANRSLHSPRSPGVRRGPEHALRNTICRVPGLSTRLLIRMFRPPSGALTAGDHPPRPAVDPCGTVTAHPSIDTHAGSVDADNLTVEGASAALRLKPEPDRGWLLPHRWNIINGPYFW